MKVLFVSRWGVQCGIATYTDQLALALRPLGAEVEVAAEQLGKIPQIPVQCDAKVHRSWDGRRNRLDGIIEVVREFQPDIIHLQHEFGLMDEVRSMLELVAKGARHAPVVVTCHTVMPHPSPKAWFFHRVLREVDGIVAHNDGMRGALLGWKLPKENVFVIPHGTPDGCTRGDRRESRRTLFLPEDDHMVIAISLGFITEGKMQHEAIDAIIELVRDGLLDPKYFLYIVAGEPGQNDPDNIEYCRALHAKLDRARAWNYIRIIPRFVPREQLPLWYGASDFVITGSHQTFFSVSGRSHQEMAFKMPSVSADVRLLSDLNEMRSLKYECFSQLKAHILTLATNQNARQVLARRCGEFARETSWPNVATKHLGMYEALKQRRLSNRKG